MGTGGDALWWFLILALAVLALFVPQWMARRRQAKRVAEFEAGDQIITIGGFIGRLTYIDLEENVARLELAEGLEVEVVPGAISRKLVPEENVESEP